MTTNIFTNVVLSAVVKKLISEAGKSALESIKNSNTNVIQEQLKAIGVETQNIFSSASEEGISLLTDNLKQVVYQILVNVDIPEFNKLLQYFYDDMSEDIEKTADENTIKVAEIVYDTAEEFNANPNTTEKVKIPFCEKPTAKNLAYILALFLAIVQVLFYSGYNIKEDFIEPFTTAIENCEITNKIDE